MLNPLKHYLNSSFSKSCPNDVSSLKSKISELIKTYNSSVCEIIKIESSIKSIQCTINQLKQQKQELCKEFEKILLLICISSDDKSIKIVITNGKVVMKKLECLGQKIDQMHSEFQKIDSDKIGSLKHSLVFNSYYLEISSYILTELECIESQQKTLSQKSSEINGVQSEISVISDNIKDIRPVIEKINQKRDDLVYVRESLCSIIPKLSKIKDSATKIKQLQCVVNGLYRIKSSIEKLKDLECEQKCLEIFESTDQKILKYTLICIRDKLDIKSITDKISEVEKSISSLECVICHINKLLGYIETIENILSVIEYLRRNINELTNGKLIKCSLLSTTNSMVRAMNDNRDIELDNEVYGLYSLSNVMDYEVLVNRLFESAKKIDQILKLNINIYKCKCIMGLEARNPIDLGIIKVYNIVEEMTKETKTNDLLKLDKINKIRDLEMTGNHVCLCMIVKYILYPKVIKICNFILGTDLDALGTISRKWDRYKQKTHVRSEAVHILILVTQILDSISKWVIKNYFMVWTGRSTVVDIKCFCCYHEDPNYSSVLSIILFLSSLVEDMWTMDTETIRMSIDSLSTLISEFDIINSQNIQSTNINLYHLNVFKVSLVYALSSNTQSCKLLAKLRIIIDMVSLSKDVPYLDWLIKPYISKTSLCNIFRFDQVLRNLQDNVKNNSNNNEGVKNYVEWVLKKYQSLNWPCKGCNNSNCCSICVNLLIFWIWMYIWLKVNIKLYESNKEYKERLADLLARICNCGEDCCCKEVQKVCEEICGEGCGEQCPCKTLKDKLTEICNGLGVGNGCLCKQIEKIKDCLTKCVQGTCTCATKEECCKCVCCKLVGHSIKILTRACRANMLEPYKRIALDLMASSKDKKQLTKSILETVIDSVEKKISLIKISHSSYPDSNTGVKDVTTVRNWGYDTQHEHHVTACNNIMLIIV